MYHCGHKVNKSDVIKVAIQRLYDEVMRIGAGKIFDPEAIKAERQRYEKTHRIGILEPSIKLLNHIAGAAIFHYGNEVNKSDVIAVAITRLYKDIMR